MPLPFVCVDASHLFSLKTFFKQILNKIKNKCPASPPLHPPNKDTHESQNNEKQQFKTVNSNLPYMSVNMTGKQLKQSE